jgi:hypothetical protein
MVEVLVAPAAAQTASSLAWPSRPPAVFVDLIYPPEALVARVAGAVVVRVRTDAAGRVVSVEGCGMFVRRLSLFRTAQLYMRRVDPEVSRPIG